MTYYLNPNIIYFHRSFITDLTVVYTQKSKTLKLLMCTNSKNKTDVKEHL